MEIPMVFFRSVDNIVVNIDVTDVFGYTYIVIIIGYEGGKVPSM